MANEKIYPLIMEPGIQRDGTQFSNKNWTSGQWCRFYRGLPKKIGGYSEIVSGIVGNPGISLTHTPRGIYVVPNSPNYNVYIGDENSLRYIPIDFFGNPIGVLTDRTPAGFIADPNNTWTYDVIFDDTSNTSTLLAFAAPNLFSIDSVVERPVYYGNAYENTPLVPTNTLVSGGIAVLHPYLFSYGNDGYIAWSQPNNPNSIMGSARVAPYKIIYGVPTRGGNSSPAGLFWSLDRLIRVTEVGTTTIDFRFDTISSESSIMSAASVIEYDSTFYWAGVDRFLSYNGIVQELPNNMNLRYFYQNVNYNQRQKVWATKVPEYGEIWWFYPAGNATECTNALIYNVREKCWYDTEIGRSSGYYDVTFAQPIWAGNTTNANNFYTVWTQEEGVDQNNLGSLTAIDSYIITGPISWTAADATRKYHEVDRWTYLYRLEPDFLQVGNMSLIVNGQSYARTNTDYPEMPSTPYIFGPDTVKIDMREQRREMSLKFESNVVGGNYEMGQILLVMRLGDARQ